MHVHYTFGYCNYFVDLYFRYTICTSTADYFEYIEIYRIFEYIEYIEIIYSNI